MVERNRTLGIFQEQRRHRAMNALAAGCLALAGGRLTLTAVPEPWPWLAEAGELAYDLSLAMLAGWVFHLLVVVLPEADRRARLEPIVARRIDFLLRAGFTLARPLSHAAKVPETTFPLLPEQLQDACERTKPTDAPKGWATDWHGLIRHLERVTDLQRLALKAFYPRLEEDLLGILEDEELAFTHLRRVNSSSSKFELDDLRGLEQWIHEWLAAVERLRSYRRHLAQEIPVPVPGAEDY